MEKALHEYPPSATSRKKHPFVDNVQVHKLEKQNDHSKLDEQGRCTKYHQSPWDLRITLAASGAQMDFGITVNKTNKNLFSLWYKPTGKSSHAEKQMEAIFFDLCEAQHKTPPEFAGHCCVQVKIDTSASGAFRTMWAAYTTNMC